MSKMLAAALLLFSINANALDGKSLYSYWEGYEFINYHRPASLSVSEEMQRVLGAHLIGYITGVIDATSGRLWCPTWENRDWDGSMALDAVTQYMHNHSELIRSLGGEIVTKALGEKYPCPH